MFNIALAGSSADSNRTKADKQTTAITTADQKKILASAPNLDPDALSHAAKGYDWALKHGNVKNHDVLTIIDFNKPSYEKRMWVIDLNTDKVMMNLYTTHGKNSGMTYAKKFSSRVNSDMTSLGVYETMNAYHGKHKGLSLRLKGLEKGINANAYSRTIVIHPAWYATPQFVKAHHRAGRSWGCFAIDPAKSTKLVNLIDQGSIIVAYADQSDHDPVLA